MTKKQIENQTDALFKRLGNYIQFNIMNLGKVLDSARDVLKSGGSIDHAETAMKEAIEKYRVSV